MENGATYPNVCSNLLGKSYINYGVGGESSYTILARMGVITPIIPANVDCSSFELKDINGNKIEPLIQGEGGVNPIHIDNDDTDYILSRNSDGTYGIKDKNDTILSVANYPRFIRMASASKQGDITVIFIGQNGARGTILLNQLRQAVHKIKNEKFIIIGLTTGTTESRKELNDKMYDEFGNKFFDAGYYLSKFGMSIMNMTPNEEDIQSINQGRIPPSLLVDGVHMNASGYSAMGTILANFISSLYYNK